MDLIREKNCLKCDGKCVLRPPKKVGGILLYWALYPLSIFSGGIASAYLGEEVKCDSCKRQFELSGSLKAELLGALIGICFGVGVFAAVLLVLFGLPLLAVLAVLVSIALVFTGDSLIFRLHRIK